MISIQSIDWPRGGGGFFCDDLIEICDDLSGNWRQFSRGETIGGSKRREALAQEEEQEEEDEE